MVEKKVDELALGIETERLEWLLEQKGIDTSGWRTEQACKTVRHLATELLQGDAKLEGADADGELLRVAHVINLFVFAIVGGKKLQLVEERQVFNGDGKVRERNMAFLSEKKSIPEDVTEGCKRALREEIQLEAKTDISVLRTYGKTGDSPSFPGLKSKYVIHEAEITLAEDQYDAEGYAEHQPDKSTYFAWKQADVTA